MTKPAASRLLGHVRLDGSLEDAEASKDPRVRQFFDRIPEPDSTDGGELVEELTR